MIVYQESIKCMYVQHGLKDMNISAVHQTIILTQITFFKALVK